ncbi:MAG: hypothetical protein LBQ38_07780 [Spirochaetaceae bacterium]|jgi:hypothetical protein|nr:hypothetical protein [Spirochaetaceae bacterium]
MEGIMNLLRRFERAFYYQTDRATTAVSLGPAASLVPAAPPKPKLDPQISIKNINREVEKVEKGKKKS